MQQDIRKLLKDYKAENIELPLNHSSKFQDLLEKEMHQHTSKKKNFKWLSVVASVMLIICLATKFYPTKKIDAPVKNESKEISLGSISPEFETIETYYNNSISLKISELEMTDQNKEIIDGYLLKIGELTKEYKSLTKELNTNGVNDSIIDALISNLQLRLQLLKRLQKQLKRVKNLNTKQNESQIL
ncbi:hypothetical protein SAMN05216503_1108 [Polaribacter sp. KT25b]|uniref:hypothetical protein n=1 Tax=Polaribacter sp. KT25b TaxID=1855336 RepID=UPI00087BD480|nr:hypothetical protein [Polaribacter sp. KT25b]SDR83785.1 hypothetical protein SAMN05216503_1108 [Polaribacter sp. KT25b]